jgi:hypothetical protein
MHAVQQPSCEFCQGCCSGEVSYRRLVCWLFCASFAVWTCQEALVTQAAQLLLQDAHAPVPMRCHAACACCWSTAASCTYLQYSLMARNMAVRICVCRDRPALQINPHVSGCYHGLHAAAGAAAATQRCGPATDFLE